MAKKEFNRTKFEELIKRKFFYTPAFAIYGGVSGLYDYGPPGCALQANILQLWRSHFILEEQMLEVDTTILTTHDVLQTSGHVDRFTDLMVTDVQTGAFYRADHLLEKVLEGKLPNLKDKNEKEEIESILAQIDGYNQEELTLMFKKFSIKAPETNNELTNPVPFNLMFGSSIGPTGNLKCYMRPETAQGQFVNFNKLLEYNNSKMPFASAQIGRAFRNEISPRNSLLRVREFTMAEIEHYVHPERKNHSRFEEVKNLKVRLLPATTQQQGKTDLLETTIGEAVSKKIVNNETLGYFLARTFLFLTKIGIDSNRLRFRQHMSNEMAHYASDCWDAEIHSSYGWIECVGCADRSCFDLTNHSKRTGERLVAREKLDAPKQVTVTKLVIDKKNLGIAFKKDAKEITQYLENMSECDIKEAQESLQKNKSFKALNKEITDAMVKINTVTETVHVEEYIPSVIEPSFGIGRILYSLLEHCYYTRPEDDQRAVRI
jgi:glycyl-tRNA synthetase